MTKMENRYDFDEVTVLNAFAVGVPGNRTFFIAIGDTNEWVRLWLEKEQLEYLSLAITRFLLALPEKNLYPPGAQETSPVSENAPTGLPSVELETEEITIGYEKGDVNLSFLTNTSGAQQLEDIEVTCHISPSVLKQLGDRATTICAAGRPRCQLCGGPIDPSGHVCPKNN